MMKKRIALLLSAVCTLFVLSGCTDKTEKESAQTASNGEHPAVVMNAPYRNMANFVELVKATYPEVNLEVIPYNGQNTTAYVKDMRVAGEMPDIYFTTFYTPGRMDDAGDFLDLSSQPLTDRYVQSRLREVTVEGKVYMLPLSYNALGITYNKTLLEKNGWTLPTSLKELEALKPQVEAAGYVFCRDQLQYPGYGFQYLCNIADTGFLSTIDGLNWQEKFLNGEANVSDTPEMVENIRLLERWRELGMLNGEGTPNEDNLTKAEMAAGNVLFLMGNSNNVTTENASENEFSLMPYLSEDGEQNVFILNVGRYVGLNKKLGESGNEQKLEDAIKVLDVLSTVAGMEALDPSQNTSRLLPLKDATVDEGSYYANILDELNAGNTAQFIYSGWENIAVALGNTMIDYACGRATVDDVIASFDDNQKLITENRIDYYTTVTETLDLDDCAKLVGICFAQATGADAALISKNTWVYEPEQFEMNKEGVSGALFALPLSDEEIVSIFPTGWRNNIETVTLTGARIKELAAQGFDRYGNGDAYPYELVTKEGAQLEDDKTYTVAICGATDAVKEEGNITDSGVMGLEAGRAYFSQFETLSKKDIIWE